MTSLSRGQVRCSSKLPPTSSARRRETRKHLFRRPTVELLVQTTALNCQLSPSKTLSKIQPRMVGMSTVLKSSVSNVLRGLTSC